MQVKNHTARQRWEQTAQKTQDPELAAAWLRAAERWAEAIEDMEWVDDEFGAAALAAHRETLGRFSTFDLHGKPCNFLVSYLNETWEFGTLLKRWYKHLAR